MMEKFKNDNYFEKPSVIKENRLLLLGIINDLIKDDILSKDEKELSKVVDIINKMNNTVEGVTAFIKVMRKRMNLISSLLETEKTFSEEDKNKALRVYKILENVSFELEKIFDLTFLNEEHLN